MKKKIIGIIIICLFLIITITNVNYATDNGLIDPDTYKPNSQTTVTGANHLFEIGNMVIGVVRTIGRHSISCSFSNNRYKIYVRKCRRKSRV